MIEKHVEYLKANKIIPKTVLEIGSRDGNDANYYKLAFDLKDSDIYIVEPNPKQVSYIKSKYPLFTTFDVAIDLIEGVKTFNQVNLNDADSVGTSSLLNRADDWYEKCNAKKIKVNCISGKTLLNIIKKEIDICKIDVEGLTYEVIKSFGDSISRIKTLHIETEHKVFWENQKLHNDVVNLMQNLGFILAYETSNGVQSDTIWLNKKTSNF